MATWPTISVKGSHSFIITASDITNHEVFAFTLQTAQNDVGVFLSNVTVFIGNGDFPNQTSYGLTVQAKDMRFRSLNNTFIGNCESVGV
jgi:hypothetical protein